LSGLLNTKVVYPRTVTHLSNINTARHKVTLLMCPTMSHYQLPLSQTASISKGHQKASQQSSQASLFQKMMLLQNGHKIQQSDRWSVHQTLLGMTSNTQQ